MKKKSYAITEVVGTSDQSIADAIRTALRTASKSINHLGWYKVVESRGQIRDDQSLQYQVVLKLGFRYDKSWPESQTMQPSSSRR